MNMNVQHRRFLVVCDTNVRVENNFSSTGAYTILSNDTIIKIFSIVSEFAEYLEKY